MTDILISARRGAGAPAEILYGTVTFKPTLAHSRSTSIVLPAPTTFDLVNGEVVATNVQPTPAPVEGKIEWAYEVTFKDRHSKTYSFLVGVPDSTTQVNFTSLPRYYETQPPLFGEGPQGDPGEAATISIGTTTSGTTPNVTNSGTNTDAVLDFVLPQGPQGPKGDGVTVDNNKLFSDPPASYNVGVTTTNATTGNGWPLNFITVTTDVARSYDRAVQTLVNVAQNYFGQRVANNGVWSPIKQIAYADLATTTANGLMSSADKSKLDNMGVLAYRSKLATDLPSTYPLGTSVGLQAVADGWPVLEGNVSGAVNVRTDRPLGYNSAIQWVSSNKVNNTTINNLSPVMYREGATTGTWGEWQTLATQDWVTKNREYVTPEQFGAVGDGNTNDQDALQTALTYACDNGLQLRLKGGTTYRTITTLTSPLPTASKDVTVDIDTYGAGKATIRMYSTSNASMMELRGAEVASTTLTSYVRVQDKGWSATSTAGFVAGNLMAVKSSASWYYDPRPESTDARKSELQKIASVAGGVIYTAGGAEDGYPVTETVTLYSLKPIKVRVNNIHFTRELPAEGTTADGIRRVGLRVYIADEPVLTNLSFFGLTASGIRLYDSYNSTVRDCSVEASNNYFEGYGITVAGCAHTLVDHCYIGTSRRGVDVSQGTYTVDRHATIQNCIVTGGGKSSRGEWFGWDPVTNALASRQSGLGSHGSAEFTTYLNNTIYSMTEMMSCNGGNEVIKGNTFIGKTNLACIGLGIGGGYAIIEDNNAVSGFLGTNKTAILVNGRRPNQFVKVNTNWNTNNGNNSRLVVRNNYAEVQTEFICFGSQFPAAANMPQYVNVTGNRVGFSDGSNAAGYVLYNPTDTLIASGPHWTIGYNEVKHDSNAGGANLTRNINLNGAKVLDFSTSGPTT